MNTSGLRCIPAATRTALLASLVGLVAGCASTPPTRQADLCAVLEQHPDWYDSIPARGLRGTIPLRLLVPGLAVLPLTEEFGPETRVRPASFGAEKDTR